MYAACLRKDIFPDNRFVGGNSNAWKRLEEFTYLIKFTFFNTHILFEMVFHNANDTGKWHISCSFAQTI